MQPLYSRNKGVVAETCLHFEASEIRGCLPIISTDREGSERPCQEEELINSNRTLRYGPGVRLAEHHGRHLLHPRGGLVALRAPVADEGRRDGPRAQAVHAVLLAPLPRLAKSLAVGLAAQGLWPGRPAGREGEHRAPHVEARVLPGLPEHEVAVGRVAGVDDHQVDEIEPVSLWRWVVGRPLGRHQGLRDSRHPDVVGDARAARQIHRDLVLAHGAVLAEADDETLDHVDLAVAALLVELDADVELLRHGASGHASLLGPRRVRHEWEVRVGRAADRPNHQTVGFLGAELCGVVGKRRRHAPPGGLEILRVHEGEHD
eukprot:scaffold16184_cov71-Phaeocystis_antarctica.AAC.3